MVATLLLSAISISASAQLNRSASDNNPYSVTGPPRIVRPLSDTQRIEFYAYETIKSPPAASFYNALLTASVKTTQEMFSRMRAPRLDVPIPERRLEFLDYSVWLSFDNVSAQLNYGTLLLSLKEIGIFFNEKETYKIHFDVFDSRTGLNIVFGWTDNNPIAATDIQGMRNSTSSSAAMSKSIAEHDRSILSKPISALVADVHSDKVAPIDILRCYGKVALQAHKKTNCLTEILLPEAENWATGEGINLKGPLAGIPISLKDTVAVGGFDASVGYSRECGKPFDSDGTMVKILKAAGAIPYVKTNLPISLLSFESTNDVWGRCTNPHNTDYSPGGSTGGESALLAYGGGRIGIGSDVAGSVRAPAHFAGIYSLRCSTGRWPKMGMKTSMPGQEGIPSVSSPMARTLDDLVYFTRSWRDSMVKEVKNVEKFKIGVLQTDGVVDPSPACSRALNQVVSSLAQEGHHCTNIDPPSPYLGLQIASMLLNSDGCRTFMSLFRTGENNDSGARQMLSYMRLPRPLKYLYYLWMKFVRRDRIWANLLAGWTEKSSFEQWRLVAKREAYKADWHEWWNREGFDFLLTPIHATPAVPHGGMKEAVSSCGYTFLFNLLDYTCGVIPITKVDRTLDRLPDNFQTSRLNGVARGAYKHYDADKMHGLPIAVQIVGRRLEEEKVLTIMEQVEQVMKETGNVYTPLDIEV
ncbi:uncharacterized protein KY384_001484 [Bacidia gigantensis]|uniref:uncharacterized protein n=1 Tax=Bacidia gigantensis TaxID=2732470 RepID=UPI001D051422|nr:uncharacterized protein KY384_001484 [Bacidia gigantensis]KAG8533743.1 hypothetical protein KY384_001484 [Bacidia gigantensis]